MKSKDHGTLHRWKRSLAICVLPRYIATCIPGMIRAVAIPQLVAGIPPIPSVPSSLQGSIAGQGRTFGRYWEYPLKLKQSYASVPRKSREVWCEVDYSFAISCCDWLVFDSRVRSAALVETERDVRCKGSLAFGDSLLATITAPDDHGQSPQTSVVLSMTVPQNNISSRGVKARQSSIVLGSTARSGGVWAAQGSRRTCQEIGAETDGDQRAI